MDTFPLYVAVYTRVESQDRKFHYRRIASLPDPSDELIDVLRSAYKEPRYIIRVSNQLF